MLQGGFRLGMMSGALANFSVISQGGWCEDGDNQTVKLASHTWSLQTCATACYGNAEHRYAIKAPGKQCYCRANACMKNEESFWTNEHNYKMMIIKDKLCVSNSCKVLGEDCDPAGSDCADDTTCNAGVCRKPVPIGKHCAARTTMCEEDGECVVKADAINVCIKKNVALGDSCDGQVRLCGQQSRCENNTCVPRDVLTSGWCEDTANNKKHLTSHFWSKEKCANYCLDEGYDYALKAYHKPCFCRNDACTNDAKSYWTSKYEYNLMILGHSDCTENKCKVVGETCDIDGGDCHGDATCHSGRCKVKVSIGNECREETNFCANDGACRKQDENKSICKSTESSSSLFDASSSARSWGVLCILALIF